MLIKNCKRCGQEFLAPRKEKQYCSTVCQRITHRLWPSRPCLTCGQFFQSRSIHRKYCSHPCWSKTYRKLPQRVCSTCNQSFRPRYKESVFCSLICKKKWEPCGPLAPVQCRGCSTVFFIFTPLEYVTKQYCTKRCKMAETSRNRSHIKRSSKKEGEIISIGYLINRDGPVCGICRKKIDVSLSYPHPQSPTVDHIIPLTKQGSHTYDNIQLAHLFCNVSRSNSGPAQAQLALFSSIEVEKRYYLTDSYTPVICSVCKREFFPIKKQQRHCSAVCANIGRGLARRTLSEKSCSVCGNSFRPPYATRKYCSKACYNKVSGQVSGRKRRLPKTCPVCRHTFRSPDATQQFCSQPCYRKIQREGRGTIPTSCSTCGSHFFSFSHRAKYCSTRCKVRATVAARKQKREATSTTKPPMTFHISCVMCGAGFVTVRGNAKYCSAHCRTLCHNNWQQEKRTTVAHDRLPKSCAVCQIEFFPFNPKAKYCSPQCLMHAKVTANRVRIKARNA